MSNHGKESTNKEGVNIDETQTKIDMGKLITQLPGSHCFALNLHSIVAAISSALELPIDLSSIPEEYHEFANVFSKTHADTLPSHRHYDLKIDLEEGISPLISPIYSLSQTELDALCEFIDENLSIGFI
jgi:hypothetical protein